MFRGNRWYRVMLTVGTVGLLVNIGLLIDRSRSMQSPLGSVLEALEWGRQDAKAGGLPTFYVFFQPSDCATALKSLRFWNSFAERRDVNVRGVMIQAPRTAGDRERIVQAAGIKFPVAPAFGSSASRGLRQLGYDHTLIAVLVDTHSRVRLVLPAGDAALPQLKVLGALMNDSSAAPQPPLSVVPLK